MNGSVLFNDKLELCFESHWRLKQWAKSFQLGASFATIQKLDPCKFKKFLNQKIKCTSVFHFTSYNLCSSDFFSPWCRNVCLLTFCIVTMCNVHCGYVVIDVASIQCKWFQVLFHCDWGRYLDLHSTLLFIVLSLCASHNLYKNSR
jgi:hypothetical protein